MIIAVFGSAYGVEGDPLYESARQLGRLLGSAGHTIMTGGYCGTMEAASRGAVEAGAHTIGVTCAEIEAYRPTGANPWVRQEMPTQTLTQRLDLLTRQADACVALPGGIGTLCEVMLSLNLMVIGAVNARTMILIGPAWRATFDAFFNANDGFVPSSARELVHFANSPEEVSALLNKSLEL
ncbi:MAG: LOG family protein [Anaerolineaceae bacterium]|jgi:hypothetical protein|nr:LOG family protein [Anaerolineaceae bacterium]HNX45803.1 LOG family protein [Anaerolineaceae bacterium]HPT23352.1 LOG family protein [Anaerolineaceae bacterium]